LAAQIRQQTLDNREPGSYYVFKRAAFGFKEAPSRPEGLLKNI